MSSDVVTPQPERFELGARLFQVAQDGPLERLGGAPLVPGLDEHPRPRTVAHVRGVHSGVPEPPQRFLPVRLAEPVVAHRGKLHSPIATCLSKMKRTVVPAALLTCRKKCR